MDNLDPESKQALMEHMQANGVQPPPPQLRPDMGHAAPPPPAANPTQGGGDGGTPENILIVKALIQRLNKFPVPGEAQEAPGQEPAAMPAC